MRIRTTNPLERLKPENRRQTGMVSASPEDQLALVMERSLRHMPGTKWVTRRYLSMDKLRTAEVEKESASRMG